MLLQCCCVWPGRLQPHLDKLRPLGRRRIPLLVFGAPAEPALLHPTCRQDATVPEAVRVLENTSDDVCHGLKVFMNVDWPGSARRKDFIVKPTTPASARRRP